MALKVHKVVVVSCPRCVLTGGATGGREGIGKSCFCNRFVRSDCFSLHHTSNITEQEWRDNTVYNGDHFLYWGAATKRLHDGTRARFQVVEQTELFDTDNNKPLSNTSDKRSYIERASATHFISRGKIAYRLHVEEEYAIPSSLKHNKSTRSTQLFPNHEFSDGKVTPNYICLYDPSLQGEDIKIQIDFLTQLIREIVKTKCRVLLACTKCDEVNEGRIQLGANLAATVAKKPIPFIQTSAKEGINVNEAFLHVISSKKRNFSRNSTAIPSYYDVFQSRSQDTTYSINTFNQLLKETVTEFSIEWSDVWPHLQFNPSCVKAVEILGIEQVRKLFCQRLMELKVQELRSSQKQPLSPKVFQSDLLEAFSNHPDLGNDSLYDFVYSPSSTPVGRATQNSISSDIPPTPTATPTITSSSLPIEIAPSPFRVGTSPPPPPPTSSIPSLSMDQTTPTRSIMFSPTKTSQAFDSLVTLKMNRSTEFLATLPELPDGITGHSSLRYRNRTLPPLPTQEYFSPTRRLSSESFTKSHPQLDDSSASFTSSSTFDRLRRLSNSMDCLQNKVVLPEEEEEEEEECVDTEASPYLRPVDVRKVMNDYYFRPDKISSCKLPRQKPRLPIPFLAEGGSVQRSRSFRERSCTLPQAGSVPKHNSNPSPIPLSTPPPKSVSLRKESPLLLGMSILVSPGGGQTSLDFPSDQLGGGGGGTRILVDTSSEKLDDTSSITSGPFAEIDDNEIDALSEGSITRNEQFRSKSHTPDLHSYSSSTLPSRSDLRHRKRSLLVPINTLPSLSSRSSPEKENLYASIPADDDAYLTMKSGISLEELLSQTNYKSISIPTAQSVIKRLKSVTRSKDSSTRNSSYRKPSPSHHAKKLSDTSIRSSFDTVFETNSSNNHSSVTSLVRPLPPSPTKLMRRGNSLGSPTKRKISGAGGGSNIYESIDENEEWFQQLKRERELRFQQKMEQVSAVNPELARKCNTIMENFLNLPEVKEIWLATVQTILPDFQPPPETSIPPFTINPEYILSYSRGTACQETELVSEVEEEMTEQLMDDSSHSKLAMTDSVVMRMNRSLQQQNSSSCSSESESEEDRSEFDYEGEEGEVGIDHWPPMDGTDTLQSDTGSPLPLVIIHQGSYVKGEEEDDQKLVLTGQMTNDENERESEEYNEEETSDEEEQDEQDNETRISDSTAPMVHQSGYLVQQPSSDNSIISKTVRKAEVAPYVIQNGHLSVCQLNSLDSGISASNGD